MKRVSFILFLVVIGTSAVQAQKNTIVGKWKLSSIVMEGLSIDLENPESTKKLLSDQIQKEEGKLPDSATLATAYTMLSTIFEGMYFEFTSEGKGIFVIPDPMAGVKSDTASYTIDYEKGLLNTVSMEEGKEKKEQMAIKFEGEYMIMAKGGKDKEIIKLKRSK